MPPPPLRPPAMIVMSLACVFVVMTALSYDTTWKLSSSSATSVITVRTSTVVNDAATTTTPITLDGSTSKEPITDLPLPDMTGRWWLAFWNPSMMTTSQKQPPWRWTMEPISQNAATCESGRRADDNTKCDSTCPVRASHPPTVPGRPAPHFATCAVSPLYYCSISSSPPPLIPKFTLTTNANDQELFTLLDTINLLMSTAKTPITITFIGDSTQEHTFNLAKCHLAKQQHITIVDQDVLMNAPPQEEDDVKYAVKWIRRAKFMMHNTNNITLTMIRNDRPPINSMATLSRVVHQSTVLVMNWGLHYLVTEEYVHDMTTLLGILDGLLRKHPGTIPIFLTHPAQHFSHSPSGWFTPELFQDTCSDELRATIEAADWRTASLREIVTNGKRFSLIPTPWGVSDQDICARFSGKDDKIAIAPRIHHIPFFDVSASLGRFHKDAEGASEGQRAHDCTHLSQLPTFGDPIWDAIYLAVRLETLLSGKKKLTCPIDGGFIRRRGRRRPSSVATTSTNMLSITGKERVRVP